jgi:hypothetical protein
LRCDKGFLQAKGEIISFYMEPLVAGSLSGRTKTVIPSASIISTAIPV